MPSDDATNSSPHSRIPASGLLSEFMAQCESERVRLKDIVDVLEDRAYGLFLLVLALPNIIPNPIPGVSGILGVPLILVAGQLALGRPHPWFPKVVAERSVGTAEFAAVVEKVTPWLHRVERLTKPRLRWLCSPPLERLLAIVCLILAVVLALPIPFGNAVPALAVSLIAIGLIEHDGIAILLGITVGIVSALIVSTVLATMAGAFLFFLQQVF